ncbi:MAG: glycosyltransferase [Gammaproteobacteria bacterium]|nr:glycosyltransferase [Gammaproteobacteria bacterium]
MAEPINAYNLYDSDMNKLKISFIIPAYNEEARIKTTIEEILKSIPEGFDAEIIVVDHGSQDKTREIVSEMSVPVMLHPGGTIASLRNFGVKHAVGDILVFVDADVLLTESWMHRFQEIAPSLASGKQILTGSWVSVPVNPNWIEKNWFKPLQKGSNTHINSGHMIISKKLFDKIGGFNEELETGEDFEISMRAKSFGLDIVDDVQLVAVHEGYPQNIKEFFLRELWHGKGDAYTLYSLVTSKVAVVSLFFLCLHLMFLHTFLFSEKIILQAFIAAAIFLIVMLVTIAKYRCATLKEIICNMFLYYIYFWARSFSLMTLFSRKKPVKRER